MAMPGSESAEGLPELLKPDGMPFADELHELKQSLSGLPNEDRVILWGDRIDPSSFSLDSDPVQLDRDPGLDLVRRACADAGIDFEG